MTASPSHGLPMSQERPHRATGLLLDSLPQKGHGAPKPEYSKGKGKGFSSSSSSSTRGGKGKGPAKKVKLSTPAETSSMLVDIPPTPPSPHSVSLAAQSSSWSYVQVALGKPEALEPGPSIVFAHTSSCNWVSSPPSPGAMGCTVTCRR